MSVEVEDSRLKVVVVGGGLGVRVWGSLSEGSGLMFGTSVRSPSMLNTPRTFRVVPLSRGSSLKSCITPPPPFSQSALSSKDAKLCLRRTGFASSPQQHLSGDVLLEFLLFMSFIVEMDLGSNPLDATSSQLSADNAASHTSRQCVSWGISHLALGRIYFFGYTKLRPSPWSSRVPS